MHLLLVCVSGLDDSRNNIDSVRGLARRHDRRATRRTSLNQRRSKVLQTPALEVQQQLRKLLILLLYRDEASSQQRNSDRRIELALSPAIASATFE